MSPLSPGEKGQRAAAEIGPGSNTGQKGQQDAIIDYLTIVVPLSALEEVNCKKLDLLLFRIFAFRGEVVAGAIRERATVAAAPQADKPPAITRSSDYVAWVTPRIQGQPWTAPAYDSLSIPTNQPPRVYCMASGDGLDANGEHQIGRCSCKTEQGTTYVMDQQQCRMVAVNGQYEPFLDTNQAEARRMNDYQQSAHFQEESRRIRSETAGVALQHVERSMGSFPESPPHATTSYMTTAPGPNKL
ncbi:hypothetical protein [Stenotrophomonas maltophilia]|uniref:hypothetical protein n=1 Tax=Stenotrophomonas maltophilia TaxID=40324 RepID=UPI001EF878D3|nr:hypothetical protein [Stenotrophomonas maltophilia]